MRRLAISLGIGIAIGVLLGFLVGCGYPPVAIGEGGAVTGVELGDWAYISQTPVTQMSGFQLFKYKGAMDGSYVLGENGDTEYAPENGDFTLDINSETLEVYNMKLDDMGTM